MRPERSTRFAGTSANVEVMNDFLNMYAKFSLWPGVDKGELFAMMYVFYYENLKEKIDEFMNW